jgi:hypothetical protein
MADIVPVMPQAGTADERARFYNKKQWLLAFIVAWMPGLISNSLVGLPLQPY